MSSPPPEVADVCPNCGAQTLRAYCSSCGEKRLERDEWKLKNVLSEVFSEVTDVENSKLWQTLRLLVFRPGQLTRDHWQGKRRSYLGPVKLYLILFALSVLLYSIHQPTALYDIRTLTAGDRTGYFSRELQQVADARSTSLEQAVDAVNSRWHAYISASQLTYPLIVALALKLLFIRRRRYFAEHLIYSLHLVAAVLLSFLVIWPLYLLGGSGNQQPLSLSSPLNSAATAGSTIWAAAYVLLSLRRAYDESWLRAAAKAVPVYLTYFIASVGVTYGTLMLALRLARSD